ncbi:MAG TPA: cob(I)yrinic acid a,c-diamide adenosyltransferase [Candidatus Kerfeldbacteria bacterium]|nr:MAG: ATP corrinoid adenosyltransferase [Parcubacteria group bacterium GW2011_GWA2_48_9]KKW15200.1 MAG: ATP corrinoid adenosyltransferase [Parcubacteria group bacterium GW2011_GWC2_49_9]HCM68487.1 cob(I)yrinic acid a,c-diamide adenosyltransferase [Candidatus Kerfeldbacteria bacterium]
MKTMSKSKRQTSVRRLRPFSGGVTVAYIGNGKGKTTAAVGAAVRARGYGWRVLFLQFYKSANWPSGERESLKSLGVDVRVSGEGFVGILGDRKERKVHRKAAVRALGKAKQAILSGRYRLVILDEVISCLEQKLFSQADLLRVLSARARSRKGSGVHLVLTGHEAYPRILARCDVVTRMTMVKHPYYKGFLAIRGIDY